MQLIIVLYFCRYQLLLISSKNYIIRYRENIIIYHTISDLSKQLQHTIQQYCAFMCDSTNHDVDKISWHNILFRGDRYKYRIKQNNIILLINDNT